MAVRRRRGLTEKQMQAAVLLTRPSTDSYAQTAAKLGVSERTLRRWRRIPEFEAIVEQAFQKRLDLAIREARP